jgi:putative monooxygenase
MSSSLQDAAGSAAVATRLGELPVITKRGGEMRFLSTPTATGSKHHIFGHLVLQPGEEVADHLHDYGEESLFVLSGAGVIRAGGVDHALEPGVCVFLPKGIAHSVKVVGTKALVAVFASAPLAPNPQIGHREL